MNDTYNLFTISLYDDNGEPLLKETGTFGALQADSRTAADIYTYELLTPKNSSPGRTSGTYLSDVLFASDNIFDVTTAVSHDSFGVVSQVASVDEIQIPKAYKLSNITVGGYDFIDGLFVLGLLVRFGSRVGPVSKRVPLELSS